MTGIVIPSAFKSLRVPKRYKVFYGGRGGAKSHNIARTLLVMGMEAPLKILCARELQKSIKQSVHALLDNIIRSHNLTHIYDVQETVIRNKLNGTEFIFIGLKHNIDNVKSLEGVVICWCEEAHNISAASWETLIPTIRKEGSEIWISFNTKNTTDPTYKRFVAKKSDLISVTKVSWRDNPFFPSTLEAERKALLIEDKEAYEHVWEGAPDTRRSGAIYAKKIAKARDDGRICRVPYDPSFEVFTAWDLGFGDSTTIWWLQFVGRELRWLDFYENSGELIGHYAKVIKEKPYNYIKNGHFLPFDGAAGNIRGESVPKQLQLLGIATTTLPKATDLRAERELLSNTIDYSVFDDAKTEDGIFALESYHFEWDEDRGLFKKDPLHDWSSHASDAARYAAIAASKIKAGLGTKQVTSVQLPHGHAAL